MTNSINSDIELGETVLNSMSVDANTTCTGLCAQIKDDLEFLGGSSLMRKILIFLGRPAFRVLFWYRLAHHFRKRNLPLFYHFAMFRMSKFGCYLHPDSKVGRHIRLPHPVGIVVGQDVVISDGCTIFQNVTIGADGKSKKYPYLNCGVTVYAGAVILGDCVIGENAIVGANSVVLKDVPPGSIAKGAPALSRLILED